MYIRFFPDHVIGPHANHSNYFVDPVDMVFCVVALSRLVLGLPGVSEKQILGLLLLYGGVQFLLTCKFITNAFGCGVLSIRRLIMSDRGLLVEDMLELLVAMLKLLDNALLLGLLCKFVQRIVVNLLKSS